MRPVVLFDLLAYLVLAIFMALVVATVGWTGLTILMACTLAVGFLTFGLALMIGGLHDGDWHHATDLVAAPALAAFTVPLFYAGYYHLWDGMIHGLANLTNSHHGSFIIAIIVGLIAIACGLLMIASLILSVIGGVFFLALQSVGVRLFAYLCWFWAVSYFGFLVYTQANGIVVDYPLRGVPA